MTGTPPITRFLGLRKTVLKENRVIGGVFGTITGKRDFLTSKVHFLSRIFYKESDEFIQLDNFPAKKAALPKVIYLLEWECNLIMG